MKKIKETEKKLKSIQNDYVKLANEALSCYLDRRGFPDWLWSYFFDKAYSYATSFGLLTIDKIKDKIYEYIKKKTKSFQKEELKDFLSCNEVEIELMNEYDFITENIFNHIILEDYFTITLFCKVDNLGNNSIKIKKRLKNYILRAIEDGEYQSCLNTIRLAGYDYNEGISKQWLEDYNDEIYALYVVLKSSDLNRFIEEIHK